MNTQGAGALERHYRWFALAVLGLAAFNVLFRLNREILTLWDESLYATSAIEMVRSGRIVATTFQGTLDYYNSKPPLAVWLIALAFKAFGPGFVSLRLASAASAWTTVAVLMRWARRAYSPRVALASGLVLSTTFGFIRIHSARSASTDALFTLLIVLTAIVLAADDDRPWTKAWLGPILAAVFLLRGMGVLMPAALVAGVGLLRWGRRPIRWDVLTLSTGLFVLPVGTWALARWQIDRWHFFRQLFYYDFIQASVSAVEGHDGSVFYYLDLLQKNQYDWLLAATVAAAFVCLSRRFWRTRPQWLPTVSTRTTVVGVWAAVTLLIPTAMQTKLPWYLNPFYPVFALAVALVVVRAFAWLRVEPRVWRRALLTAVVILAGVVAETKLVWYSFHNRDLADSVQGLILTERVRLSGHFVFRREWDSADRFVLREILGARGSVAADADEFLRVSHTGDYLVTTKHLQRERLLLIDAQGGYLLYQRRE